jgi:hypothetical protein
MLLTLEGLRSSRRPTGVMLPLAGDGDLLARVRRLVPEAEGPHRGRAARALGAALVALALATLTVQLSRSTAAVTSWAVMQTAAPEVGTGTTAPPTPVD